MLRRLTPTEARLLVLADIEAAARRAVKPVPSMRERIRQRLRAAVHDMFAREAARASEIGDPVTEHPLGCPMPDDTHVTLGCDEFDMGDGAGLCVSREPLRSFRHNGRGPYPFRLGSVAVQRRRAWLAEHRVRLDALERS